MIKVPTPDQAIEWAVMETGLEDFGMEGWREGLERSLDGFARLPLLDEARDQAVGKIVKDLSTRLRIEQWFKDHPDIADLRIEGPVFVMGLPRTGTTATVGMMALDDDFRFLRGWEAAAPLPPPIAGEEDTDPRVLAARAAASNFGGSNLHIYDVDGPMEDLAMLAGLHMHSYHGPLPMPQDYIAWWKNHDFTSFYAYHARLLKLLQSRRPPNLWLLKSPPHLLRLREIARQYPNAKFVMTHRDPVKILGSVASLHFKMFEERCLPGSIDKKKVGPQQLGIWTDAMQSFLSVRAEIGEHRFVDVMNNDVVNRPVETFERIYEHIGREMSRALRGRLRDFNAHNMPGTRGAHEYTAEEYGLTYAGIREAFSDYGERFGLWEEVVG